MAAPKQIVEKAETFEEIVAIVKRGNHVAASFIPTLTQVLAIHQLAHSSKS
jgi:glutamine amidotransferase PdxT